MSWIAKLYQTYENCQSEIGRESGGGDGEGQISLLLPIVHTTMNANVELTLNYRSECVDARALSKEERVTIIPCTEESASRSGITPIHHPLFDKLQYMAGDYRQYGGEKGGDFYRRYMQDMEKWCVSPYQNRKVKIVYAYLKKGCLIADLLRFKVLICGQDGKLMDRWTGKKEDAPPIFKVAAGSQRDVTVRIRVELPGDVTPELWKDPKLYEDYARYYLGSRQEKALCYGSGQLVPCGSLHPKKIVPFEANAKLLSANDNQGFTFRGRFLEGSQVAELSYEMSQKAHNALRWLIDKQGYTVDKQCFLAWGTKNEILPPIMGDSLDFTRIFEAHSQEPRELTGQEFAKRFNLALAGYKASLDSQAEIVIIGLMAATPGRLSITFYRELPGDDFLNRIQEWHHDCEWYHAYRVGKDKKRFAFAGAPSPKDIVFAAYGANCGDKLKRAAVERILYCIMDRERLPADLMQSASRRASNLVGMKEQWERDKTLSVACALYRKYCKDRKGVYLPMSLDNNNRDRSYLYGRLLAVADYMERLTFDKWYERDSNALRYQAVFAKKPYRTWQIIRENLLPYVKKLYKKPASLTYLQDLIGEINDLFESGEFAKEIPLEPLYLHGYDCQMRELRSGKKKEEVNDELTE